MGPIDPDPSDYYPQDPNHRPMFVFDKNYVSFEKGSASLPLFANEVYLYLLDDCGNVINAVIGLSRRIPDPDDEVTYVMKTDIKDVEDTDVKIHGRVITKAEYETWHEFEKS